MHRAVHQTRQSHFGIAIVAQGHHLIPVAGATPVALNEVVATLVRLVGHGDGIGRAPFGFSAKLAHHPQGEVDVGAADNLACELQGEALFQHRTNHEQGRDVLRAHVARYLQQTALQLLACDLEWWESLFTHIFYISTQTAQGINQYGYGAMFHAVGTCNDVGTTHHAQVGTHESHGGTCSLDVYFVGHISQCVDNHLSIIAIAQVFWQILTAAKGIDDERTIRDTF